MKTLRNSLVLACVALGAMLAGAPAIADTVTINGTNPTQNTDGSSIAASGVGSLTNRRLEYGTCSAPGVFGTSAGFVDRAPGAPGAAFSDTLNLNPGTSCVRATVTNTYGSVSDPSNITTRTVAPPVPKPPTLATVPTTATVTLDSGDGFKRSVAYTINSNGPGVVAGFVKVGTPATSDPVFSYRGQDYCKFLPKHPRTGAPNLAETPPGTAYDPNAIAAPCA